MKRLLALAGVCLGIVLPLNSVRASETTVSIHGLCLKKSDISAKLYTFTQGVMQNSVSCWSEFHTSDLTGVTAGAQGADIRIQIAWYNPRASGGPGSKETITQAFTTDTTSTQLGFSGDPSVRWMPANLGDHEMGWFQSGQNERYAILFTRGSFLVQFSGYNVFEQNLNRNIIVGYARLTDKRITAYLKTHPTTN